MRSMNIISLAAVASGSVIQKRATTSVGITDFSADCTPHGTTCSYSFNINPPGGAASIACSGTAPEDGIGILPTTSGTCTGDSAYTWFTAKIPSSTDLLFDVQWVSPYTSDVIVFCHPIPQSDINTQNDGATTSQHYVGAKAFTVDVGGCPT